MGSPAYEPLTAEEIEQLLPRVISAAWRRREFPIPVFDCHSFSSGLYGIRVLFDAGIEEDGQKWVHVSISREDREPSWEDLTTVKRLFLGDERWAYQVIPPQSEFYNVGLPGRGLHVLHLWSPLDNKPRLPNFLQARGGTL
jgi:hypothetical protein